LIGTIKYILFHIYYLLIGTINIYADWNDAYLGVGFDRYRRHDILYTHLVPCMS